MFNWSINLGFMNIVSFDAILLITAVIMIVSTALTGFSKSISKHAGFIFGILVGIMFAPSLSNLINENYTISTLLSVYLSYISLFIITFILMYIFGSRLSSIFEDSGMGQVDTILGLFYGLFEALMIAILFNMLITSQGLINIEPEYSNSILINTIVKPISNKILPYFGDIFANV